MAFENKQKITEIDLGWQAADYVSPLATVENDDKDVDPSTLQFAWFKVDSSITQSADEEKERIRAMQFQFENKIINKHGLPYGMSMPKELKDAIDQNEKNKRGGKWCRKRQRLIDRQIEKDVQVERNKLKRDQEEAVRLKSIATSSASVVRNISNIKLSQVLTKLTDI